MASKVIGFRVPEDLAEELEKVSEERGMTVTEFMRILVDETLYPATDNKDLEKSSTVVRKQLESLANERKNLANEVQNLSPLLDNIVAKLETYETEGILTPDLIETVQKVATLKSQVNTWESRYNTLSIMVNKNSKKIQDVIVLVNKNRESSDGMCSELHEEVSLLGSQLGTMKDMPLKVERIETDVNNLTTNIPSTIRGILRQPTDETHTLPYKDRSEHRFRVYKSPAGLVKPHVVIRDPISGNKYVDLNEPLD